MSIEIIDKRTKKIGIGPRLRGFRKNMGIRVDELAKIIGVSHGTLSEIENEKTTPSAETLQKICRNVDIDMNFLLTGEKKEGEKTRVENIDPLILSEPSSLYCGKADPDLVEKTARVLSSNTGYAASLAANIRSFYKAVETEELLSEHQAQIINLTERLAKLEKFMGNNIDRFEELSEKKVV